MVPFPDRLPPQSLDAEQATLGAALIARSATERVLEMLGRDDFYLEAHRKIYDVIAYLDSKDQPADMTTVPVELQRRGQLENVGGIEYVSLLTDAVPTAAHVDHYAELVQEKADLRSLIDTSNEIIARSYEQSDETGEIIDTAQKLILKVGSRRAQTLNTPAVVVDRVVSTLLDQSAENPGLMTGLRGLDALLKGLQRQELVILAGRPGMGKSDLMLEWGAYSCRRENPIGIFSLEMSEAALIQRWLRHEARVDGGKIRGRDLEPADFSALGMAGDVVKRWPFRIDPQAGLGPREVVARARKMVRDFGARMIFVDNLQRMDLGDRRESTHQAMAEAARRLKDAAKDLDIVLVALSHLTRLVDRDGGRRPMLSDLRESGGIEAEADIVLGLYRKLRYDLEGAKAHKTAELAAGHPLAQEAEIGILKSRDSDGEGLWLKFDYWGAYGLFQDRRQDLPGDADAPPDYERGVR